MARQYRMPDLMDVRLCDLLDALGDPVRLHVVKLLLARGENTCAPLADQVGVSNSTLTHHLRQMREAGLIRVRPEGVLRWSSLRIDELEQRFPGLFSWLATALINEPMTPASPHRIAP